MFQFANLTPGDYTIYSFPKFEDVEFRKPAFLQALSGAFATTLRMVKSPSSPSRVPQPPLCAGSRSTDHSCRAFAPSPPVPGGSSASWSVG
jgi:hypothetical protein